MLAARQHCETQELLVRISSVSSNTPFRIGLVVASFCAVVFASNVCAANSSITFTSPAGGEVFFPNKTYTIRLATKGNIPSIALELSRDGGQTFSNIGIIDNTSKDKSTHNSFTFKPTIPYSADCLIRATAPGKTAATATSMPFTIGNASLTGAAPGTVTGDVLAANTITSANLANNSILTATLADGSVTTPKIADSAVTNPKIANLAVNNKNISSGPASNKQVLTADGLGGADWSDPNSLGIGAVGIAGGDLSGTYPNPSVAATAGNNLIAAINNAATTSKIAAGVLPVVGAPYVLKAGDTLTGFLTLNADPTANLHAASKQYVDAVGAAVTAESNRATAAENTLQIVINAETTRATGVENSKINASGDAMTGPLILPATGAQGDALIDSINSANTKLISASLLAGILPALDGSNLTAVNAAALRGTPVSSTAPSNRQVLAFNSGIGKWEPTSSANGTVTNIAAGTGISTGGVAITSTGTISIDTAVVPQLGQQNTFSTAQIIQTGAAGNVGLTVSAASNQAANLLEFVNNVGAPLTHFDKVGNFSGNAATATTATAATTATNALNLGTVAAANFARIDQSNTFTTGQIIETGADGNRGLVVQGNSTNQSANLQEWYTKNTDLVPVASVSPAGTLNLPADGLTAGATQLVLSGGKVGIGTSSPGTKLDIVGGAVRTDSQLISTVAGGTAPLSVASQTLVSNLNVELLQGKTPADFASASGSGNYIQNQSGANQAASFQIIGRMIGTASAGNVALTINGANGKNIVDFNLNGGGTVSIDPSGNFTGNAATATSATSAATAGTVTGTVPVANGGTGQTSPAAAFNAIAPAQSGNNGKFLTTNGTTTSWATPVGAGTVTDVTATAPLASSGGATPNITFGTLAAPTTPDPIADAILGVSAATQTGLVLQGKPGQLANLQEWQDSNGTVLSAIDKAGAFNGNAANVNGTVPLTHGGTGQTSASAAFDALSPTTTVGDLIVHSSGANTRLPVGADGMVLVADSASGPGIKWASVSGTGTVTSVVAGAGLTGGTISTTGTIQIDSAVVPQLGSSNNFTVSGSASNAAMKLSGDWFTLGTSTTSKPQLLVEASGANSTGWNAQGTGLGVNASAAFTGNLIDAQSNGASKFSVDSAGAVTAASFSGSVAASNVTGVVNIANGGTGAAGSTAGFNALSPLGAKGDIVTHNGTDNIKLPVGANGQVLMADSSSTSGLKWGSATGGGGSSALAVSTTSTTTTVNVSGVSVLVLKSGTGNDFDLVLNGLTPGQIIIVENSSGRGVLSINGDTNCQPQNNQAQLVYVNDAGTLHSIGGINSHF